MSFFSLNQTSLYKHNKTTNSILNPCTELTNSKRYTCGRKPKCHLRTVLESGWAIWDRAHTEGTVLGIWRVRQRLGTRVGISTTHTERWQSNCKIRTNYWPLLETEPPAPQASDVLGWRSFMRESRCCFPKIKQYWLSGWEQLVGSVNTFREQLCPNTLNKSPCGLIQGSDARAQKYHMPNHS